MCASPPFVVVYARLYDTRWLLTVIGAPVNVAGAAYVLIARMLVRHPRGGLSGEDAFDFYGLVLVSFWMSIVLMLDR